MGARFWAKNGRLRQMKINKHTLRALKKKWAGLVAASVAARDYKQAENWQEAIEAADEILEHQRSARLKSSGGPERMAEIRAKRKPRARRGS